MTTTVAPIDAVTRSRWLWDALFALVTIGTSALIAVGGEPLANRLGAIAIVVACWLGWPLVARRMAMDGAPDSRPAELAYCVAIACGLVAAVALAPAANWAMFLVGSQLFWLLRLPQAIVATVVLTLVLPVTSALVQGPGPGGILGEVGPASLFLSAFGILVGVFIHRIAGESAERAQLISELERSQAEVSALSHRAGVTAERERLAGEIHDTLAQGFTSIVTLLQAAQAEFDVDAPAARRHVELAVRSAKENLKEARHLVAASAPGALAAHSLADAVGRQVEQFADEKGIAATHATTGTPRRLPAEQEVVVLRAAQELVANVGRHACARTVTVRLDYLAADAVTLTVTDDGTGFDPDAVTRDSYGLAMMRTRAERLGGHLTLRSTPTTGTQVTLRIPT